MKLLFLTQTLDRNDAVLGFVSRWVEGLARACDSVRVIALEVGDTQGLPANVSWREVGREGRIRRYFRYRRWLSEAFKADGFDCVLAHMVPRYTLLAARQARRAGAGQFLWYTHAGVDARLRRAVGLVQKVFTATEESLRVETPAKRVTGHGIDLAHFEHDQLPAAGTRILSVGRLTPRKDPLTLLRALAKLLAEGHDLQLDWVGAGLTQHDDQFAGQVERCIEELGLRGHVELHGAIPYRDIPAYYERSTLVINASLTGSLDKVTLEAMASRRPVISCNDSAPALFAPLGEDAAQLFFEAGNVEDLTRAMGNQLRRTQVERDALGARLRAIVASEHEVDGLMARLVGEMSEACP